MHEEELVSELVNEEEEEEEVGIDRPILPEDLQGEGSVRSQRVRWIKIVPQKMGMA